ncbi:MAG: Fe-S cluster assembly ATPase SufC [Magnetococcales bacterium]|nr:Fe-S cluster assembly ATPase SufC [Magnetococcales bacterium]
MLNVEGLHAAVGDRPILRGVELTLRPGEVHALMGPNGSGKSTLVHVLAGRPGYRVTAGRATLDGVDLLAMEPEQRAGAGVFLGFQHPVEIPGVSQQLFLKTALNALRRRRGEAELDASDCRERILRATRSIGLEESILSRSVNAGFSGGEKKQNELLQMATLTPRLALLDEMDSGLDIDALARVSQGIQALRGPDRAILLVTHHQRMLDWVVPDRVHVMIEGRIVLSGGSDLARELERRGYGWLMEEAA